MVHISNPLQGEISLHRVDDYGWHGVISNGYEILQYEIHSEIQRCVFVKYTSNPSHGDSIRGYSDGTFVIIKLMCNQ